MVPRKTIAAASFIKKGLTVTNSMVPGLAQRRQHASHPGSSSNVIGGVFVPQTPESYTYDADGNLTLDGHYAYTWDAENRLVTVTDMVGIPCNVQYPAEFHIPIIWAGGIQKIVSTNNGMGSWVAVYTNKFIYDGWNPIAVLDGENNLLQSFTWGADLSGTVQNAGGVGGLTSMTIPSGLPNAGTYFPAYDGNGNVMALVNAATGSMAAQYEYDPFGTLLQATGPLAYANNILFSSKWFDWETGLSFYGYRFYNPTTGRWLSDDPIEEHGGYNLYGVVGNDTVDYLDTIGLEGNIISSTFPGLSASYSANQFGGGGSFYGAGLYFDGLGLSRLPPESLSDSIEDFKYWVGNGVNWVAQTVADELQDQNLWDTLAMESDDTSKAVEPIAVGVGELIGTLGSKCVRPVGTIGENLVYRSVNAVGQVNYIGITGNLERRAAEQLAGKGIIIQAIPGLQNLSRADVRAVEQALIEYHGLSGNGGTLLNLINSISPDNPIYPQAIEQAIELLRQAGCPGF